MKLVVLIICLIAFTSGAAAQDLMLLEHAQEYARHKVKKMNCMEVKYSGNTMVSTVPMYDAEFDARGRVVHYTEYFARGRKMAEYHFEYDDNGKMITNSLSIVFDGWTVSDLILTHDDKGRLISRAMTEPNPNFWMKEVFIYDTYGKLLRSEYWYDHAGILEKQSERDYPQYPSSSENTLTYIHNEKGLLMIHQFYNKTGDADKALQYEYAYFD